jgi:hypothetical protein
MQGTKWRHGNKFFFFRQQKYTKCGFMSLFTALPKREMQRKTSHRVCLES